MKVMAFVRLLAAVSVGAQTDRTIWMGNNPDGRLLRQMFVFPSDDLITRINERTATLAEVEQMFRESKPPKYRDAFYAAPEVTVIMTPGKNPKSKVGAFRQLLVSKRGGVTDFWFLYGTGRGCLEALYHVSNGAGQSLKDADSKAGPVRVTWGLVELWAEPRLCRETR